MPKLDFERHVPHSPEQMLALAWDVRRYPEFVPNCSAMEMTPIGKDGNQCRARMHVQFGPISQTYTSHVIKDEDQGTVTVRAIDGPFSHLVSTWQMEPENSGTRLRFEIDFAISNRLLAAIAEPAFAAKQEEVIEAFMAEADRRYSRS